MLAKLKSSSAKKAKLKITTGVVHISSSFNNTIVTITNLMGDTVSWASAGSSGFKGARKSTAYAATLTAQKVAESALSIGISSISVEVKGP